MLRLTVNGQHHELDIDPDTPLLWALRDHLHLHGAKYGCGIGLCGSCTVHVDGKAVRSCIMPLQALDASREIVTIEGALIDVDVNVIVPDEIVLDPITLENSGTRAG